MFEGTIGFDETARARRLSISFTSALAAQLLFIGIILVHSILAINAITPPVPTLRIIEMGLPEIVPPTPRGNPDAKPAVQKREEKKRDIEDKPLEVPVDIPTDIPLIDNTHTGDSTTDTDGPEGPLGVPYGVPDSVYTGHKGSDNSNRKKPLDISEVINPPKILKRVNPIYPRVAHELGMQGYVVLEIVVNGNGSVVSAKIIKSSSPVFEKACLDAVRKWVYSKPSMSNGQSVSCYMTVTMRFKS